MGALWATTHRQWARFMKRFATVLGVACVMFVLIPTAPPWMAYEELPPARRRSPAAPVAASPRWDSRAAVSWKNALDWGNAVAAMPSLHASFALIVPAFFLPWIKPMWLKASCCVFPVDDADVLVYLGEHWVIDGLVGWAIVGGSFWFWNRIEDRQRRKRAHSVARSALAAL